MSKRVLDIAFVILHYMAVNDTIECIKSIEDNIDTKSYRIIVVDNASPNGSGLVLFEKYKDYSCVKVILNEKNLGFASFFKKSFYF